MVVAHNEYPDTLGGLPDDHPQGTARSPHAFSAREGDRIRYEAHPFTTSDDYVVTLYRRRAEPGTSRKERPVLFLHGANSNRFCFGVNPDASFTGYLNRLGYDVWLLEFRGARSSHFHGSGPKPQNLDAKIRIDLPEAIQQVLHKTQTNRLDLIGHSLGGIFIYAYLGANPHAPVGRAVTICSPAHVRRFLGALSRPLKLPARMLAPLAPYIPGLGVHHLAKMRGPLPHLAAMARHIQPETMNAQERRNYLNHAVEDMTGGDLSQLMRWFGEGGLSTNDGGSYYDVFSAIQHPILVLGSDGDNIAQPDAVREAYNRLGTPNKKFLFVGKRFGSSRNYSHQDLLLAPSSNLDIYPLAQRWLERD